MRGLLNGVLLATALLIALGCQRAEIEEPGGPDASQDTVQVDVEATDVHVAQPDGEVTAPECSVDDDCEGRFPEAGPCNIVFCETVSQTCQMRDRKDYSFCDDGLPCTSDTVCVQGECTGGTELACDDLNPCTEDSCDPDTGDCVFRARDGEDCDDGDPCTLDDTCDGAICRGTTSETCGCDTDDDCTPLDDGDLCTGVLVCVEGFCRLDSASVVVCPPGPSDCQAYTCQPDTGECVLGNETDGSTCEDGNPCTMNDTCDSGECLSGNNVCPDCEQDSDCDDYENDNLCDGTLICEASDCVIDATSIVTCDPSATPCRTTACNPATGACEGENLTDGISCDDTDPCTVFDQCLDGRCEGRARDCDDGNPCTVDDCDSDEGCVNTLQDPSDGDVCNGEETCDPDTGATVPGTVLDCDDDNPCTNDWCHPVNGCQHDALEGAACDDGDPCTEGSTCDATGACVTGDPVDCNDGNLCNGIETCDPTTGECLAGSPVVCGDDNACNGTETCNPLTGSCEAGVPITCSDGNPCNGVETCDTASGDCVAGDPVVCEDDDVCDGLNACDPTSGECVAGDPPVCDDEDPCNGVETCDPVDGCQAGTPVVCEDDDVCNGIATCDSSTGECVAGTPLDCDDENVCNGTETCDPIDGCVDGTPLVCNDGDACNGLEICDANTGCVAGTPLSCDDGDACNGVETCDSESGCVDGTPLVCDDGDACNGLETCDDDEGCLPGTPLVCGDEDVCNGLETCDPDEGCVAGEPLACDDEDVCNGVETCDPVEGCLAGEPLVCDDEDICNGTETCDAVEGCLAGEPLVCDDGDACNGVETCDNDAGGCVPGETLICDDEDPCTEDACDTATGCVYTPIPCETICDNCQDDDEDGLFDCDDPQCAGTPACAAVYPVVTVLSPARAATLSGDADVMISGLVTTPEGTVDTVTVTHNGTATPLTPAGDGSFAVTVPSQLGLNTIVVDATNSLGYSDHVVQAYYYSTSYYPVSLDDLPAAMVPDAGQVRLGADFWDDDDTSDVDDVATVMLKVLERFDLNEVIPSPVGSAPVGECVYEMYLSNLRYEDVDVDITPTSDGARIEIRVFNLRADATIPGSEGCEGFDGTIVLPLSDVSTTLELSKERGGEIEASMFGTYVRIDDIIFLPDCGPFCGQENIIRYLVEGLLEDELDARIPALIVNNLLDWSYEDDTVVEPLWDFVGAVAPDVYLRGRMELATVQPTSDGPIVTFDAAVAGHHAIEQPATGSLARDECLGTIEVPFAFPNGDDISVAVHDDIVNEIMYAMYAGGAFRMPITPADIDVDLTGYGLTDVSLYAEALLPPVITACGPDGQPWGQVGDVRIAGTFSYNGCPMEAEFYMSASGRIQFAALDGGVQVSMPEVGFIGVDTAMVTGGVPGTQRSLAALFEETLIPAATSNLLGQEWMLYVPTVDVASYAQGSDLLPSSFLLPAGLQLGNDILDFVRVLAYTVMSGRIELIYETACTGGVDDDGDGLIDCDDPDCDGMPGCGQCLTDADCVPLEDGDLCNGTLICVDDRCIIDMMTVVVCVDDDFCNGNESCNSLTGECIPGTPVVCDDEDACNGLEVCNPTDGACIPGIPVICDDGDFCNGLETCDPMNGACLPGDPVVCDDEDVCNGLETCDPTDGSCLAGVSLECDDDDVCTEDSCDPIEGCVNAPIPCEQICDDCTDNDGDGLTDCDDDQCAMDPACTAIFPEIVISSPPRAATMDDKLEVLVEGQVLSADGPVEAAVLTFNGVETPLALAGDGSFSVEVVSTHGLNTIEIDAVNTSGYENHLGQSYYFSTKWYPMDPSDITGSYVEDGGRVLLGPSFLDDDDVDDLDDVATLLGAMLERLHFEPYMPSPLTTATIGPCTYEFYAGDVGFGQVDIDIEPVVGALLLEATIHGLAIDVVVPDAGTGCDGFAGEVYIESATVATELQAEKVRGSDPVISTANTAVSMTDPQFLPDCGPFCGQELYVRYVFQGILEDEIDALVPGLVDYALPYLTVTGSQEITPLWDLLHGAAPRVTVDGSASLATLDITPDGVEVTFDGTVMPALPTSTPVDSIGRDNCLLGGSEYFAYPGMAGLQVALHDDVINQGLYSLWVQGAGDVELFQVDIPVDLAAEGVSGLHADLDLLLPPIVTSCTESGEWVAQVGDAYAYATFDFGGCPIMAEFSVSAEAPILLDTLTGDNGNVEVSGMLGTPTFVDVDLVSLTGGTPGHAGRRRVVRPRGGRAGRHRRRRR